MANCEQRIDDARARVFAADDGVVTRRMTDLEREWRKLSALDPESGLMDLWADVAPPWWIDRKRFRDSPPDAMLDALVALASDPEGVETAERSAVALAVALRPHGVSLGAKLVWRPLEDARPCVGRLLAASVEVARAACPQKIEGRIVARADALALELEGAALSRHPARPGLAQDLAAAARLDFLWSAASLPEEGNPAAPLRALYGTGYVLAAADAASVTLAFPPV